MSRQGVVPAGIVHQLLDNENYLDWSVWVKTYLMGEDLWDIVESMDEPPKPEDGDEFKYWRSKNASALHVIQISCNADAFSEIRNITSAKEAWDTLEVKFKPQSESTDKIISDDEANILKDQYQVYTSFHKAAQNGDLNAIKEFITRYPNAVRTKITHAGRTALYVAAIAGHTEIVETLVGKMSPEDLEMKDIRGYTPLAAAIIYNANIKIAECMVKKNKKLLTMLVPSMMPAALAIYNGYIEMGRYLYSVTPLEDLILPENHIHAATLMAQALYMKCYDVALHLLERCPRLATTLDIYDKPPLAALVDFSIFPSGCPLKFWQKRIYEC
ncbi:ankyrin repeat-containing protein ITN1-like [Ziziphus jujuba]|uniref:Ankyrin repeat-containing protein ITN1-like n=1 Tax=Ziziphus jujuba TaxID=326968 RepID=A0ABM4AF23_ZIZJJ|nr:ankyrin repeat-containing protein ITN1-like [Ziziphus jujuba]